MKFLKKHWPLLTLALFLAVISLANIKSGTWLAGWDNLMPELNLVMNIKRSLVAVWQEYQGLGLVGGMAHAADLVRQLILLPFSLIMPANYLRYFWHLFMLGVGTFGIFSLLKNKLKINHIGAFLGSLFYLLNFGTIQIFWVPFEPFSCFWGFFSWLILIFWQTLEKPVRKNWLKLFLINLLATPSFYLQTIFLVYLFCLGLIAISFLITKQRHKIKTYLKTILKTFSLIFLSNGFWLLPFTYFLVNNLENPLLGIGNQIASQETFARSQARGGYFDFLLLKGHYLDYYDLKEPLMAVWQKHFDNPIVLASQLVIALVVLAGIVLTFTKIVRKKINVIHLSLFLILLLGAIAFVSDNLPFSFINLALRQSSFLNQTFRAPLTKFIVPVIFVFSCFFALGIEKIVSLLKKKLLSRLATVIIAVGLIYSALPVFNGNLFYDKMQVNIPREYFELIDYFKHEDKNARIANLPQGSYWGWTFYRWGMRGSGFLWYGIEQPILDRAFDVWSLKNEQYYWELNYALQKRDLNLLEQILTKYRVSYILFDDNVFFPGEKEYAKLSLDTKELLEKSTKLKLVKTFGSLSLYETDTPTAIYSANESLPSTNPADFYHQDPMLKTTNSYQIDSQQPDFYYPFFSLFTNRFQKEQQFEIKEEENNWLLTKDLPENITGNNYSFIFDPANQNLLIPTETDPVFIFYQIVQENNRLILKIPKINSPWYIQKTFNSGELIEAKSWNDTLNGQAAATLQQENKDHFVSLSAQNDDASLSFNFPELPLSNGWLIEIEYRFGKRLPLYTYALGGNNKYKFFSTKLETEKDWTKAYFIIPPFSGFDYGINLTLQSLSFNNHWSVNHLKSIKIIPFPFELIQTSRFEKNDLPKNIYQQTTYPVSYNFLWFYTVSNIQQESKTLILPQSFDIGWQAFSLTGKPKILKHMEINNWANGWQLQENESKIIVFFWPQLLEFFGFLLLPAALFYLRKTR